MGTTLVQVLSAAPSRVAMTALLPAALLCPAQSAPVRSARPHVPAHRQTEPSAPGGGAALAAEPLWAPPSPQSRRTQRTAAGVPTAAPPTPQLRDGGGAPVSNAGTQGRAGLCRRRAGDRSRPDAVHGTAGTEQEAPCGGEWKRKGFPRAFGGKRVLPGLYLSWSPRCYRLGAPRARRPQQRPGTGPCLRLPPLLCPIRPAERRGKMAPRRRASWEM